MSDSQQMSFWEHLDDLRRVIFRIVIVMAVISVTSFVAMPWMFDNVIMAPCSGSFVTYGLFDRAAAAVGLQGELVTDPSFRVDIVSLELTSQLFVHLSAAFLGRLCRRLPHYYIPAVGLRGPGPLRP